MFNKLSKCYNKLSNQDRTPDFLTPSYLPSLDGWRAIGVIMVLFGHAKLSRNVPTVVHTFLDKTIYAELGVQIFFVLSGFLITIILIKTKQKFRTISLKEFYIKRALRILPVFYLYLFVLFILNLLMGLNLNWQNFTGPLLFVNNFKLFDSTWLTGHTWSLAVEEQFYLLWPLAFILMPKKGWLFCLSVILAKVVLNVFWYLKPEFYNITMGPFLSRSDALLTGCLSAILCFKGFFNNKQKIWSKWHLPALCAIAILLIYHHYNARLFGVLLVPFGDLVSNTLIMFLIIQSVINRKSLLFKILNLKIIKKIGVLSYSIYIWQQLFLVPKDYNNAVFWNIFPYNILFALCTAYLSYTYFESFFLRLKDHLRKNHPIAIKGS
ncbi:MAG: acyltransferase [Flavobacterium sp.]|nr:acyltransferase [Flavobacterium sp.]